jgi:hypothetical protein
MNQISDKLEVCMHYKTCNLKEFHGAKCNGKGSWVYDGSISVECRYYLPEEIKLWRGEYDDHQE